MSKFKPTEKEIAEEMQIQAVDAIILRCYNELHDNFFQSEFVAAREAAKEIVTLLKVSNTEEQ